MAITTNHLVSEASGSVGKQIVYKKYHDKVVISNVPDMSNRVLSEKQKESNRRMQLANFYAKAQYSTPESKMAARVRLMLPVHKSLYHALVKEHMDHYRRLPLKEVEALDKKNKGVLAELKK